MLRPILNRFFGKELSGQQILLETVALLSTGAIAQAKKELITIPKPETGQKVVWSEKAQVFSWSQSTDDVSFPNTNIGHKAFKYFMFYGVDLKPNTAYTIVLTDPTNSYHFTYGDSNNPLDPASLTTDKYGNILPIPAKLQFLPASGGSKSGSLTLTANDGVETVTINFKGTGI